MIEVDNVSISEDDRASLPDGTWHAVITRHNIHNLFGRASDKKNAHPTNYKELAGASSKQIELRSLIFEMCAVASICAQTNKNFDWIIVTSEGRHIEKIKKLQALMNQNVRLHVHVYSSSNTLHRCEWLHQYAPKDTKYIITTNLDDDDALPLNYIEAIQSKVAGCADDLPPMMTFGSKSTLQWELISTREAPFGYRSGWHLGNWVRSPGHSLFTRYEKSKPSVLALMHVLCDVWFEEGHDNELSSRLTEKFGPAAAPYLADFEKALYAFRRDYPQLLEEALEWKKRRNGRLYFELGHETGPAVMTNHFWNASFRLVHSKHERSPVLGAESFPSTSLRLDVFKNNRKLFKTGRWSIFLPLWRESRRLHASKSTANRLCAVLKDVWRAARL